MFSGTLSVGAACFFDSDCGVVEDVESTAGVVVLVTGPGVVLIEDDGNKFEIGLEGVNVDN